MGRDIAGTLFGRCENKLRGRARCTVCGARRFSRRGRGGRRLVGARFGRWREETVGRARC